ncbi:solute carrier organic anion transporter family member 1C1-like [Sinocyclocheilus anshuiensis]|uniref:solute carrier organic anion transporter family member 1C1-like n=1 Tax=Sinocyclocheilus anshuiensis TaxID=1608454 RepID=UPI0007B9B092|nr:PREDICTED: solute carrier organic anion transporter family member 1C1-like [Sinocyclocheilus anshuiensis]
MTVEGSPDRLIEPRPMEYSGRNQTTPQAKCCSPTLKIFIGLLAVCYFTKSLMGAYTKSTITQIERRFEIPSSTVGIIDGSFEMGNLLVITVVSYFVAKFNRPKIIGSGVLLMGIGTLLMALPHFIMGRGPHCFVPVEQETSMAELMEQGTITVEQETTMVEQKAMGKSVTITPQDSRWVGAWWLVYVVAGLLTLLAALPLWFLPRALPENPQTSKAYHPSNQHKHTLSITEIAKDFGPSLKRLLTNGIYLLYLVYSVLAFNAFAIVITYTPKYLEQQFGQSTSKTNFLIGVTSIPPVALGMFLSGWIMKRFKLGLLGSARLMFFTSVTSLICIIPYFALSCENIDVAGVTVPYQGSIEVQDISRDLLTSCNADCGCPDFLWDPVCGQNGVTYISPCHADCYSTRGTRQNMTFHGCTCIQSWGLTSGNSSAVLGQCSRESSCTKMFYIYLALQSLAFFVYCLGTVPFFLISLRIVDPVLKSLSVGILLLVLRVFGGIPAPICFGALIDSTCLKWGQNKCGGRGAWSMYDIETFRYLFLGLVSSLRAFSYTLLWIFTTQIKRKVQNDKQMSKNIELQYPVLCYPEQ